MGEAVNDWDHTSGQSTAPVMFYEIRDVFRWSSVTGTVLFALVVMCLVLALTGVAGGAPAQPNVFEELLAPLGALPDLTAPAAGGAGIVFTSVGIIVFAPLAWTLGRALRPANSPVTHCLAFTGLGAFLGLAPVAALGVIGGGLSGLTILLNPVCWVLAMAFAGASAIGWMFAYRRQDEPLDWRWWEILAGQWYFAFRR